ncbi:hypothetical protein ACWEQL_00320 [Kitasatospora sp. NPDC004240]
MTTAPTDAVTALDAARAALIPGAEQLRNAVAAVLAALYPEATYVTVHVHQGEANIGEAFTADGHRHPGPHRAGRLLYPTHRIGRWPLTRLPKRAARPHFGPHADDDKRTLNSLLTDAWRCGARFTRGHVGRYYTTHLKLR